MPRPQVPHTVDFDRIAALPRRVPTQADAETWAEVMTAELRDRRAPRGTALRPWQAYALAEAAANDGAWLALPVGVGKFLISVLLPVVMHSAKWVLIVPASLRDQTWDEIAKCRGVWKLSPAPMQVLSREELALEKNIGLLARINPDLIVVDESDEMANAARGTPLRIDRHVVAYPHCRVVTMTGTPSRNSIMGYWHLVCWALRERAPVPMLHSEAVQWAAALDEKARDPSNRPRPGPLGRTIEAAREWYRLRLLETPGVLIVDGDSCVAPLTIRTRLARECSTLNAHYEAFAKRFENPGGIVVSDPLSRWMLDAQMGCGIYSYYDPPPPDLWRVGRRSSAKFVRDTIAHSQRGHHPLDTEGQVFRRHPDHPAVKGWLAVRDSYDPAKHTRVKWFSDATIKSALDWLAESDVPGIVWCGSVEVGRAIAKAGRLMYFGRQGKADGGVGLHKAPVGRSLVASWQANKRGFNLQAWPRQLIVLPPQSAKWLEQIIGRSHRSGQDSHVFVDILLTSGGTIDAFEAAIAEAQFARGTVSLTQKILRAEIVRATPRITSLNKYRWASRQKPKDN
jgi:hypothetical protein